MEAACSGRTISASSVTAEGHVCSAWRTARGRSSRALALHAHAAGPFARDQQPSCTPAPPSAAAAYTACRAQPVFMPLPSPGCAARATSTHMRPRRAACHALASPLVQDLLGSIRAGRPGGVSGGGAEYAAGLGFGSVDEVCFHGSTLQELQVRV